jgi:hypothetical protein
MGNAILGNVIWREGDSYRANVAVNCFGITEDSVIGLIDTGNYHLMPLDHFVIQNQLSNTTLIDFTVIHPPRLNPALTPIVDSTALIGFDLSTAPQDIDEPNIDV